MLIAISDCLTVTKTDPDNVKCMDDDEWRILKRKSTVTLYFFNPRNNYLDFDITTTIH